MLFFVVVAALSATSPLSALAAARASPPAVAVDAAWGDDGFARLVRPTDDDARAVAVDAAGRVLVAGVLWDVDGRSDLGVVRLLPDGAVDASFGAGGVAIVRAGALADDPDCAPDGGAGGPGDDEPLPPSRASSGARAVVVDGARVVLAGYAFAGARQDAVVARLLDDGRRDDALAAGGLVRAPWTTGDDVARAIVGDGDGYVLAGRAVVGGAPRLAIARVGADGALDASFGAANRFVVIDAVGAATCSPDACACSDGACVPAGPPGDPCAATCGADANAAGTVVVDVGGDAAAVAIARSGGRVVAAGVGVNGLVLVALDDDGALVPSFGAGGVVADPRFDDARALLVDGDGRLVVVGGVDGAGAIARYDGDGAPDATFGDDGVLVVPAAAPFGGGALLEDGAVAAAVVVDGDVLLVRAADDAIASARSAACTESDVVVGVAAAGARVVVATKCWDGDGWDVAAHAFVTAAEAGGDGGAGTPIDGGRLLDARVDGGVSDARDDGPDGCGCTLTSMDAGPVGLAVAALFAAATRRPARTRRRVADGRSCLQPRIRRAVAHP